MSKGFSMLGLRTVARNARARGVKAPPVMNTTDLGTAGSKLRSAAKKSMPVICGIMRSQRITSNR